jgi:hypothetical protein
MVGNARGTTNRSTGSRPLRNNRKELGTRTRALSYKTRKANIPTLNFAKNAKFRMGHPAFFGLGTLVNH